MYACFIKIRGVQLFDCLTAGSKITEVPEELHWMEFFHGFEGKKYIIWGNGENMEKTCFNDNLKGTKQKKSYGMSVFEAPKVFCFLLKRLLKH